MIIPALITLSLTHTLEEVFVSHFGKLLFLSGFLYLLLVFFLVKRNQSLRRSLYLKNENLKEEINTLNEQIKTEKDIFRSLEQKSRHYNYLRDITNKIQNLSLREVSQNLVDFTFFLLGKNEGCCLLYLVGPDRQKLILTLSKKENKDLVVKQKQGDIFDRWVVRHTSSLLIEDAKTDFRFDLEKTGLHPARSVSALISAPLRIEERFLGILRLDNKAICFYSQDDLRFLDAICNIGALGLENALLFQNIQELAIKDSLTSVYTKAYYLERLNEQIQRFVGQPHGNLSLLMIDIDNFKKYNDRYGHIAGDILLKDLGKLFLDFFLNSYGAMVCRFGGEEFSVFLPDISKKQGQNLAQDLRRRVEKTRFILRREPTQVTVSIGLACLTADMKIAQNLILKADRALYRAKQKGRNQVCVI